ncbi:hypothetical protein D9619_013307 [Psilocybe cf. subviscida]|uniref:F-box domain-containing protein n=1 Tax=Psilocybe cf. subviscida TaxID=2480587 RepID=A0A8H5F950_9AGAR|nr:hypothetical protein D9619_013307 [Psilocybe cf. subviscida]
MSHTTGPPISSLPHELLGLVITHASLDNPSAPLRLAGVSRTFHRVAMSTPGAWTKLSLCTTGTSDLQMTDPEVIPWRAVRKAKMWFQRAGACTVDVDVEMGQISQPPKSADCHASSVNDLDRGYMCEDEAASQEEWGILLLPHVLSSFQHRIRSLVLHTTTPGEAQAFFDAVYSLAPSEFGPHELPLETLILVAATDGASHARGSTHLDRVPALKVRPPPGSISDALCRNNFSRLEHLTFVNHLLPLSPVSVSPSTEESISSSTAKSPPPLPRLLSAEVGHRLRSLCITYPLRFAPIPLLGLLDALRATPGLEKLQVEGRISLGDISYHNQQNQGFTPGLGHGDTLLASASLSNQSSMSSSLSPTVHAAASTPHSPVTPLSTTSSSAPPYTHSSTSSQSQPHPPLALPCLSLLALKANNLPTVISSLVLPTLRELQIEDMDGKRRGAAFETAEALRGLLVRGEMPLDGLHGVGKDEADEKRSGEQAEREKAKGGLEVLDMCNITLCHPRGIGGGVHAPHSGSHMAVHYNAVGLTHLDANDDDAAAALWRWCFHRMCHLRELRVAKMDVDALLGYITPPLPSSRSSQSRPSTSSDDYRSREGDLHRYRGHILLGTGKGSFAGAKVARGSESEMVAQVGVDDEILPSLKRLVLAGLGGTPGAVSSVPPLAGDAWNIDHASSSASVRVFKMRRPDVVLENALTRSGFAVSPGSSNSQPQTVHHAHESQRGRIDYLSFYL